MDTPTFLREADLYLFETGKAQRAYLTFGCHRLPDAPGAGAPCGGAYSFAVWAPRARAVSVVGDFNGWDASASPMRRAPGHPDVWWCAVPACGVPGPAGPGPAASRAPDPSRAIRDGSVYKFAVTGSDGVVRLKADPFAFHAENGLATGSKVWDLGGYAWGDGAWMRARAASDPLRLPMSVYEVHLGSWRTGPDGALPNYRAVGDRLAAYCVEMGYTHVEFLPLTEHPLPASWGYQTTGYYAVTSRFGTPQDFMCLVDTLHRAGVGVILDWAPAHFPKDDFALARFDGEPLYEYADPRLGEHAEWGTLVFDYGRPQVVSFLVSSAMFLMETYHLDGLRVDAVSSMLYLDYARTDWVPNKDGGNVNLEAAAFLRTLNGAVLTSYPGAVTVAEESTSFPMVTRPPYDGGLGFTLKWDMGFMHDTLDYLALDPLWRRGSHEKLTFSMMYAFSENFVLAFSHDEVVHGKRSMVEKMFGGYLDRFKQLRALMGLQFAHPGKKLTFMGSEFAQVIEWDYAKELDWFLLRYPVHDGMRRFSAELNAVYRAHPALWEVDDSWEGFSWANVDDRDEDAVAFLRMARRGAGRAAPDVLCCCNFSPNELRGFTAGLPCAGTLVQVLDSDEARFGGSGGGNPGPIEAVPAPFGGQPFSARVVLPPFSAVYFEFRRDESPGPAPDSYHQV